jgi:CelD/BcsL family acetyltransferase involved in cellulose biosynthesis
MTMIHTEVRVVRTAEALERCTTQWEALARHAIERNPFYEPCALIPAWRHLASGSERALLIYARPSGEGPLQLIGLFPLAVGRRYRRTPLPHLTCWRHLHCYLCTPLVHRDFAAACFARLFAWLDEAPGAPHLLDLSLISGDGPFFDALRQHLAGDRRAYAERDAYSRSALELRDLENGAVYRQTTLSKRRRKGLRRATNRLQAHGTLATATLERQADVQRWAEDFLALEERGRKGREGTALRLHAGSRQFFTEMVRRAFDSEQLLMVALTLDGQPIAMQVNLVSGTAGFAFKTTYDEQWAKWSPGVLLELAAIDHLLEAQGPVSWIDSCVAPQPSFIDSLWNSKRDILSCAVSSRRPLSRLLLNSTTVASALRARGAEAWRRLPVRSE